MLDFAMAVAHEIAQRNHTTWDEVVGRSRMSWITNARREIAGVLYECMGMSFPEIARVMQRKCHSSAFSEHRVYMKRSKEARDTFQDSLRTLVHYREQRAGLTDSDIPPDSGGIQPAQPIGQPAMGSGTRGRAQGVQKNPPRSRVRRNPIWAATGDW